MFKAAKMKKFRVVFFHRVYDDVIAGLHELGVAQLKEISEPGLARMVVGEEVHELSSILAKFRELEEFLGRPAAKPALVKKLTFAQTLKLSKKTLSKLEPKINLLRERSDSLDQERQNLLAQIEMLEKFREVKFPLKYLLSTDEIYIAVGYIAEDKVNEFIDAAKKDLTQRVFISVLAGREQRIVIVACRIKDREKLSPLLYRYELKFLDIPPFERSPQIIISNLEKQLAVANKNKRKLELDVKKLTRAKARGISRIREMLDIQRERLECAGLFGRSEATTVIEGWIKTKQAADLERLLTAVTQGHHVLRTYDPQPIDIEAVPIELENPKVVKDFEYITNMYGLPRYDEIDPTPFLTFTFALFFGLALSDAGYGVALGLFMASGAWFAKALPLKIRHVMVVCSVFTVLAGILIGGWFGFGQPLWTNPIQKPIPLLKLVIFIGIIHILVGIGFAGILKDIHRRNWKGIIFDRIARVLIIIGFFGLSFSVLGIGLREFGIDYAFPKTNLFSAFNPTLSAGTVVLASRIIFYAGLAMGIIGAVIAGKSIREKFGGSINTIYNITGYIADVTSYARLLALGIATGVIAFSINLILGFAWNGMMPKELTPLSAIFAVLLLIGLGFTFIVAHSFNIFINTLGGFIHTMRLHFAEFFGKFYEGGAEKFVPFKAKRAFTKVEGGELLGR